VCCLLLFGLETCGNLRRYASTGMWYVLTEKDPFTYIASAGQVKSSFFPSKSSQVKQ
jgi:hypothetical protein